jgi:hypothetical protein
MEKGKLIFIVLFLLFLVASVSVYHVKIVYDWCKENGEFTNRNSICFSSRKFCEYQCELHKDEFSGQVTEYSCFCKEGIYTVDERIVGSGGDYVEYNLDMY